MRATVPNPHMPTLQHRLTTRGNTSVLIRSKPHGALVVHRPLVKLGQVQAARGGNEQQEQLKEMIREEPPNHWEETHYNLPPPEESHHCLLLPEAWEKSLDEITAKYLRADERLNQMERQLLEMIRSASMGSPMLSGERSVPSPPPPRRTEESQAGKDGEEATPGDKQQQQQHGREGATVVEGYPASNSEKGTAETSPYFQGSREQVHGGKQGGEGHQDRHAQQQRHQQQALLTRQSLFDFNRLQSTLTELMNSGYIESVKQLRETLLIQEWDMNNRHLAKRRAVSMFERYVAERGLLNEVGGYETITGLYDDPDKLEQLIPDNRMKMLARSMMEECLNERKLELYQLCSAQAERMASQTTTASAGRVLSPLKQQAWAMLIRVWKFTRNVLLPMGLLERALRVLGRK